jgi:hypothetical protein
MTDMHTRERDTLPTPGTRRRRSMWTVWAPYAAVLWSMGYGLVALVWTLTGTGYPLGENDPHGTMSLLQDLPSDVGAPLFASAALASVVVGLGMLTAARSPLVARAWRRPAIGFGIVLAVVLLFVIPDTRVLAFVGYAPFMIAQAPFDAEVRDRLGEILDGAELNHVAVIVGGFLWLLATLVFARRTAGTCERCGRGAHGAAWTTPAAAARWGRWFVYVAAAIPVVYAATRWIWVTGIPLGIDADFHAEGMADGSLWSGAWLASFALVGSVLTFGLVQRWGEVFPRWMIGLAGRRVPSGLAVIPASVVAVLVTQGSIGLVYSSVRNPFLELTVDNWAAIGPVLLWPLWGVALGAATLAYHLRRRGTCDLCHAG